MADQRHAGRLLLAASLLLGSLSQPVLADEATRLFTDLGTIPLPATALVDDSTAINLNPGAAGARDLFELYVSKSIDPNVRGHVAAFMGLPNLSLGFQQFEAGILGDLRKFSAAYTYPLSEFISVGLGYHLTQQVNLANSNIHSFDAGMLIRPARFLSFGVAARNLNTPFVGDRQIRRAYALGVGVRPFGERLTLTADAQWDEGDPVQQITGLFGLETEPIDGLLLRGAVDLRGQFMLGAGFQFELLNAGYYHSFNGNRNADGLHLQVTNAIFENAVRQIGNHFAYIDLTQGLVPDNGQPAPLIFNQGGPLTYWQLLRQLELAKNMNRYKGVVLDVGNLSLGLGMIEEVRAAIQALRDSGKQVIVYLNQASMAEYYLATAADQVVLHPLGSLQLNGFAYVLPYYRKVLDTLGVNVDFVKVGKYKTGLESYTQTEASEATVEQYKALQDDDFRRFAEALQKRRQIKANTFARVVDKTMFSAIEGKESGLIDKVAYRDEVRQIAADMIHQPSVNIESLERLRMHRESWEARDKIAVVYVSGTISEGRSGRDLLFGENVSGSQTVVEQIFEARENPQVKALVLRVNSPGGSALASDEIYRALMRFKELTNKPVIVSMGDVAASGGYWIALAGDKILANPSTVTGSIGIYAGKVNLAELYQTLGVQHTVIKTNEKADQNGTHRGYTEAERQVVQNNLRDYYRIFLERVAERRKMDFQRVEEVAQGRVYTGEQAEKIRLVDQLGNLQDAIQLARDLAKVNTEEIQVLHLPSFSPLADEFGGVQALQTLKDLQQVRDKGLLGSLQASLQQVLPSADTALAILDPGWQPANY